VPADKKQMINKQEGKLPVEWMALSADLWSTIISYGMIIFQGQETCLSRILFYCLCKKGMSIHEGAKIAFSGFYSVITSKYIEDLEISLCLTSCVGGCNPPKKIEIDVDDSWVPLLRNVVEIDLSDTWKLQDESDPDNAISFALDFLALIFDMNREWLQAVQQYLDIESTEIGKLMQQEKAPASVNEAKSNVSDPVDFQHTEYIKRLLRGFPRNLPKPSEVPRDNPMTLASSPISLSPISLSRNSVLPISLSPISLSPIQLKVLNLNNCLKHVVEVETLAWILPLMPYVEKLSLNYCLVVHSNALALAINQMACLQQLDLSRAALGYRIGIGEYWMRTLLLKGVMTSSLKRLDISGNFLYTMTPETLIAILCDVSLEVLNIEDNNFEMRAAISMMRVNCKCLRSGRSQTRRKKPNSVQKQRKKTESYEDVSNLINNYIIHSGCQKIDVWNVFIPFNVIEKIMQSVPGLQLMVCKHEHLTEESYRERQHDESIPVYFQGLWVGFGNKNEPEEFEKWRNDMQAKERDRERRRAGNPELPITQT